MLTSVDAGDTPAVGYNHCGDVGQVFLYREVKHKKGEFRDATNTAVVTDGHIVEAANGDALLAVRCFQWNRGFPGDEPSAARATSIAHDTLVRAAEQWDDEVFENLLSHDPMNASAVLAVVEQSVWYRSLSPAEVHDLVA